MDVAGWHHASLVEDIGNVNIILLPSYSRELNLIVQVWSLLRQHHLDNRCFSGIDDIVNGCSIAWNDFISDIKRVIKICSRNWFEMGKT